MYLIPSNANVSTWHYVFGLYQFIYHQQYRLRYVPPTHQVLWGHFDEIHLTELPNAKCGLNGIRLELQVAWTENGLNEKRHERKMSNFNNGLNGIQVSLNEINLKESPNQRYGLITQRKHNLTPINRNVLLRFETVKYRLKMSVRKCFV